jgi:hypothetical protein
MRRDTVHRANDTAEEKGAEKVQKSVAHSMEGHGSNLATL